MYQEGEQYTLYATRKKRPSIQRFHFMYSKTCDEGTPQ